MVKVKLCFGFILIATGAVITTLLLRSKINPEWQFVWWIGVVLVSGLGFLIFLEPPENKRSSIQQKMRTMRKKIVVTKNPAGAGFFIYVA